MPDIKDTCLALYAIALHYIKNLFDPKKIDLDPEDMEVFDDPRPTDELKNTKKK